MTHIALNAAQISRLWTAIKQTKPDLYDDLNRSLDCCKGIYVETDLQGVYFLTFNQRAYYEQRVISWDSNDDIHDYIMNGSEN